MDSRRLDKSFSECASLLTQVYLESKAQARTQQNAARDALAREVGGFAEACKKQNLQPHVFDLDFYLLTKIKDCEVALAQIRKGPVEK